MSPLLSIRDLAVAFRTESGPFEALHGLSLDVPRGRTLALVGESGSGKSVTAQAILRILPPSAAITRGQILFRDGSSETDIARLPAEGPAMRAVRGQRIAMIFQEPMTCLSPLHTIGDQIGEALRIHTGADRKEADARTEESLARVGFPDPHRALRTYPFELSGGLRQRAMIAMALILKPALLVADEPTTALDVTTQAQILALLARLQEETGMAILLITHDLGVVANIAHDVAVMYRGRLVEAGPRDTVMRTPGHAYLRALLHAVPRFDMAPGERLTPIRPARAEIPPGQARPPLAGPVLEVEGVSKTFTLRAGRLWQKPRLVHAVADVSLSLKAGETLGLVGESGSGKTTVSKMIMRALAPDSGRILFDDGSGPRDVHTLSGDALFAFRRNVQFVFQDPYASLDPRMTVRQILSEPMEIHGVPAPERRQRCRDLMAMVGLEPGGLGRYPHAFSGGQRQRIGIARALAAKPRLLVLDEPVSALDVSVQAQILNLLKDLQAALGLSYLIVSHNLAVIDYMADTISVMCRGRIVEEAPRAALFRRPVHPYTRALLAAVPDPSLDHPLDFAAVTAEQNDPTRWAEPYRLGPDEAGTMRAIEAGHRVRFGGAQAAEAA
ncbi:MULTISPECIES: ABC transporter ATP-binding protein [Methylobacterium]|uniref:ABC transporter ATP-binding protein n=1 Tax=Methylobacterium longum TaxID=767694 RepID=A0ABT8AMV8_9HYPH|nr:MULTISPECIES: ABC transporter ATP-binding protein [Methylobacterium]MCJ2101546.1 ABC transporter ATP-binding protein [Methylobacterium sp. E-046]MDN3570749.1 ABC transporter ATP-binding protein [Methylobacterium longum]GJE09892.1 Glutathione import ATP-binding protein GsiA [Methylobacterium longum]